MADRLTRTLAVAIVVLLAALVAQPYVDRWLAPPAPAVVVPRADLSDLERASVELFQSVAPSVVQVAATPRGADPRSGETQTGTGFVWDADGHVVTNAHVVANATNVVVRLASGDTVAAEVIGRAPTYDLAVLRLAQRTTVPPPIRLGASDEVQVGQLAYAIGNPFGLDQSLTMGIVSALKRRLPTAGGREVADVIQTDTAINPGNSGGPLLDSAGRLIGVNTAIFSPSGANAGIGFAIPADVVNRVVPALIRDGRVPTPGIGIVAADAAIAAQLNITGVVVADVVPGSPADQAGLEGIRADASAVGDVIVAANGDPVRHLSDLIDHLDDAGVGGTVTLTLRSGAGSRTVDVAVIDLGRN